MEKSIEFMVALMNSFTSCLKIYIRNFRLTKESKISNQTLILILAINSG